MDITRINDVIAIRAFNLDGDEAQVKVTVVIGKPERFHDSFDYFAPYQIKGVGNEKVKYAGGIDSIQQ